ncbi:hypothetical protein [Streptomyces sp. S.PNR 29]|uniref:hypothetical protein n=1 Tax=Streptomyces sp. S.PNR 29 TaxID=2973805 RepID=UPI0025AF356B|nr:hypothetical protein [Streptomyces sp. S.PNR 29]MDN0193756.1 hypothetical protein [Streptomyces sp. S.PNR 29]
MRSGGEAVTGVLLLVSRGWWVAAGVAALLMPVPLGPVGGALPLLVWAYRRRRRARPGLPRLTGAAASLILSAFLASGAWNGHCLPVVLSLLLGGPVPRGPWFWLALVARVPGLTWFSPAVARRGVTRGAFLLCVWAVAVMCRPVRRPGARPPF